MATTNVKIATRTTFLDSFLKKRLDMEGFVVEKARTGQDLIALVKEKKTNIVIVQAEIEGTDGFEVCRTLKSDKDYEHIPVLLLSGDEKNSEIATEVKANAFLKIPFDETEFIDVILRLLKKKKTILLVDDSRVIHTRTGEYLRENGFVVMDAYNGVEGLEMTIREKPDLVISDVEMPKMDGYAMCKEIKKREETAQIPVIIVSSLGKGLEIEKGFEVGANDYLVKPVVHNELLSCMNTWLRTMEVRRRETILVVDDSETVVNMLNFGLKQQGFTVISCTDGEDAYEKAMKFLPDAIVADLDMPRLNGAQLVKFLREREDTRHIPVVIISSRESRSDMARILRVGAASFVSKPCSIDRIVINVERLTAERRLLNERESMKLFLSEAAQEFVFESSGKNDGNSEFHAVEKNLTILFSDIVGFTTLCEQLKPHDIVNLLNDYLDAMTTVLKSNDAIIDKYVGDAILAIFGGSGTSNNPGFRAVKAAHEMLEKQIEFNKTSLTPVQTRVGINAGRVIFGEIGSRHYRRDFTVIGDAVNTAQRLQSAAEPDTIIISDAVYATVRDKVSVEEMGFLTVKGKKRDVKSYRVIDVFK